jgi:hypothetical protein
MALAERLWTRDGAMDGLGVVPGIAVLPHFGPGRLDGWRTVVEAGGRPLTWIGLDERTLLAGRPGDVDWTVAGAGRAYVVPPAAPGPVASAAAGESLRVG